MEPDSVSARDGLALSAAAQPAQSHEEGLRTTEGSANARSEFLRRSSPRLVRRAGVIAIEDFAVKNMVRNKHLDRVISDAAWVSFGASWSTSVGAPASAWSWLIAGALSPKARSACGPLLEMLKLSVRAWTCPDCRTRHDRDRNAAENILAAGRAVTAWGADIRWGGSAVPQSATKQEASA